MFLYFNNLTWWCSTHIKWWLFLLSLFLFSTLIKGFTAYCPLFLHTLNILILFCRELAWLQPNQRTHSLRPRNRCLRVAHAQLWSFCHQWDLVPSHYREEGLEARQVMIRMKQKDQKGLGKEREKNHTLHPLSWGCSYHQEATQYPAHEILSWSHPQSCGKAWVALYYSWNWTLLFSSLWAEEDLPSWSSVFPICKLGILTFTYWGRQRSLLVNTSLMKLTSSSTMQRNIGKSHGKAGLPPEWGLIPVGEEAASCSKESSSEGCFMGPAENIGDTVKHKDTSSLSWRSHPFCLTGINYWPDSSVSPLGHHPMKGRAFIF